MHSKEWHKSRRSDILFFQRKALKEQIAKVYADIKEHGTSSMVRLTPQPKPKVNFRDWREALKARRLANERVKRS